MWGMYPVWILISVTVLFGACTLIRSATILVGQIRRKEMLSLDHVHIVLVGAILFDIYTCYHYTRLASFTLTGKSSLLMYGVLATLVLVVLPYSGLVLYGWYQRARPQAFTAPRVVSMLADPKGLRDAIVVTLCMVAIPAIMLVVPNLGRATLLQAAEAHHTRMAEKLLAMGADPNVKAHGGWTPLAYACRNNDVELIRLLLQHGADVTYCGPTLPLNMASRHRDLVAFDLILEKGVNVNTRDQQAFTPLIVIAHDGTGAAVRRLLEKGADANAKTHLGQTALMNACAGGNEDVVKVLLEYGAEVNAVSKFGQTALISACWWKSRPKIVKALLDRGADVNARQSVDGQTPLMLASERDSTEVIELLLAAGSDVNARDKYNNTALNLAIQKKQERVAELLKKHGAER